MGRASASALAPGGIADAEALWYDLGRWRGFVDGFAGVVRRDDGWPEAGTLVWDSTPAGRGRVVERVSSHTAGAGQVAEVEDERLRGTQRVSFEPAGDATRVTLSLEYSLKQSGPLTPLVDFLFVRRALADALRRTVVRFALERRGDVELGVGAPHAPGPGG